MLRKLFELFRDALFLARDVRENRDDVARLKQQVKDLSDEMVALRSEMERGFENERHEREKFMLRVENALLRFERTLTEGKPKKRK